MRTRDETLRFVAECASAIEHTYLALSDQLTRIERYADELDAIRRAESLFTNTFVGRDQWSPHANHRFAQYVQRLAELEEQRSALAQRERNEADLRAMLGATGDSTAILAGTVLQFGKQVLSYRYARKPNLPNARVVGTQQVAHVIWEGRNHALHWEEPRSWGSNPSISVTMLRTLQAEIGVRVVEGSNNALAVLSVLGWINAETALRDLRELV